MSKPSLYKKKARGYNYLVQIRLELSGPGVQFIAGAPSNVFYKSGELNPRSYCQSFLNLLAYLILRGKGDKSMPVNPQLSETRHHDERGEVNAFYVLILPTTVEL